MPALLATAICANRTEAAAPDRPARHVVVYHEPGRFGGWPANHGIWAWDLVGFSAGYYKDLGLDRHAIDREKPERHLLARSLDGGETWQIEDPSASGALIPEGKVLHGIVPPELPKPVWRDFPGGIDFRHPDFAMTLRTTDVDAGPSRFFYSYDRGRSWEGPFRFPDLGTFGVAARTEYIVEGPRECLVFLTAAKADGEEGRPFCAVTRDGGRTWEFRSWIGPDPSGFAIMPSAVRISECELYVVVRRREGERRWLGAFRSMDNARTWQAAPDPVESLGAGNPPSVIRLKDGRLGLTYGVREEPFRIAAKVSGDGGRSWSPEIRLREDGASRDVGYVRSIQRPDGRVVTVYYFNDEQTGPERYIAATLWSP